ncbi:MAG: OmpA family protein [Saprospiraceae bacterium]|nr:OmpA family protein [Saprospiraceae bacterium]
MKITTISFLFGLFLCTTSQALDINSVQGLHSNFDNPSNPWVLEKLYVGQIIELNEIEFEMDQASLNDSSKKSLSTLGEFLIANKSVKIEIGGHTSSIPSHEYCDKLSNDRAQSVRDYLISLGISPENIVAKGYGKRAPKYSNHSSFGRKSNQRVNVTILAL